MPDLRKMSDLQTRSTDDLISWLMELAEKSGYNQRTEPDDNKMVDILRSELTRRTEVAKVPDGPAPVPYDKHEREVGQLIDERDAAEEALSQAFYLVAGRSPEWSNLFGYKEALDEIDETVNLLKQAAKGVER